MKKLILASSILLLSGCQSPIDDMLNNQFMTTTPQEPPAEIQKIWVGNMGPYLASIKFEKNGSGLFCYSYGTSNVIQKIKYSDRIIYIQDGTKLTVSSLEEDKFIGSSEYFAGESYTFYADSNLTNSSVYCSKELH